MTKYYVRLGRARGREVLEVDIEGERATIEGASFDVRLVPIPGTPIYHLLLGGESWTVAVQPVEGEEAGADRWMLGIFGERIEVEAADESMRRLEELASRRPKRSGPDTIVAPMPGLVVRIPVTEGQRVQEGTGLVVVEAMKMENELRAPHSGVVGKVHVRVGDAIEKGAPLITLESQPSG